MIGPTNAYYQPPDEPDMPDDPAYLLALWMGAKDTERATQLVHWLLDQAGLNELPADAILGQLTGCRHEELMMTDYLDKRDR